MDLVSASSPVVVLMLATNPPDLSVSFLGIEIPKVGIPDLPEVFRPPRSLQQQEAAAHCDVQEDGGLQTSADGGRKHDSAHGSESTKHTHLFKHRHV